MMWRNLKIFAGIAGLLFCLSFLYSFRDEPGSISTEFRQYFAGETNEVLDAILTFHAIVAKKDFRIDIAKAELEKLRLTYKSIDGFVIYFLPFEARAVNRPIIAEMEEDDEVSAYMVPHGLQYLEILLYSDSVEFFRSKIKDETDELYTVISRIAESIPYMDFPESDVLEAMQMKLIRQSMLGLANFETAESRNGPAETSEVLRVLADVLKAIYPYPSPELEEPVNSFYASVSSARMFLDSTPPREDPDFFKFYSEYYIPVSGSLSQIRHLLGAENPSRTTALNFTARSIFDPQAFNTYYFLPASQAASKEEAVSLGRTLFFDPALSANNLRACASCHQPEKAFTDGLSQSLAFEPGKKLLRNAPTLVNAVLQRKLFHDGRAFTFEDQAGEVMSNPLEMHNDFSQVSGKLRKSPEYVSWFRRAFAGTEDTIITSRSILMAIAEYERSLLGMNSRFDKTISGRYDVMSEDEKQGFNVFMGKGNCASCHFIPLFNGTMLPEYIETEWEILGVPALDSSDGKKLDKDPGRAGIIDVPIFMHAFKSLTIRNIELTAPYMHNGVFLTLEEVVDFYDGGGGIGLGYDVPFQTLGEDSLRLTPKEKSQLIAFMKSLTDTTGLTGRPAALPSFPNNEELNLRPIGGQY